VCVVPKHIREEKGYGLTTDGREDENHYEITNKVGNLKKGFSRAF
jgi:hypothetical protein